MRCFYGDTALQKIEHYYVFYSIFISHIGITLKQFDIINWFIGHDRDLFILPGEVLRMLKIDKDIMTINDVICSNIDLIEIDGVSRALIAQNLLSQSRNLVEHIAVKLFGQGKEIEANWQTIPKANTYIKQNNRYQFLRRFHEFLQESKSHYTPENEGAERLLLKYYHYYLMIRDFMKTNFGMDLLNNLEKFPLDNDKSIQEYHEKITEQLAVVRPFSDLSKASRLYVHKVIPFAALGKVQFEVTLTPAYDTTSKFDRFVCYSKEWVPSHYSIKADINNVDIELYGKKMPISILSSYEVSMRPCELNNFAKIWGENIDIKTNSAEYRGMMQYLTKSGSSLLDVVSFPNESYENVKNEMFSSSRVKHFEKVLDSSRKLILSKKPGTNIIRYLLHTMNNKVLKNQYSDFNNNLLSNLRLDNGCIPFDNMPYASSLVDHNPEFSSLFASIESDGREHEFLSCYLHQNMKINSSLYTKEKDLSSKFSDIDKLIQTFNSKIYRKKHLGREIKKFGDNYYISEAYDNTKSIIDTLLEFSQSGMVGYDGVIKSWLLSHPEIESEEKKEILLNLFSKSRVSLIYGAAGTGKTYLVNYISQLFGEYKKLLIANTNPAVENLKRKISAQNCKFSTIRKYLSSKNGQKEFDILLIDECSMVSNGDMAEILDTTKCKLIVLVGDTYQIESISFGNWFSLARYFLPANAWWELTNPYRTDDKNLLELWKRVRELQADLTEHIVNNNYSSSLDASVFDRRSDDEIILCLNYDGLYGINNINRFLQNNNPSKAIHWDLWTYKKGDPILFNESERFLPVLYNNLKGKIEDIVENKAADEIWFTIEVDKPLMAMDAERVGLELLPPINDGKSLVKFKVTKKDLDVDNDVADETDIPFQIAYAVSIHKAQGLEYDSVKIIISREVDEMITHNIFYTAITRSKKHLSIYWSPETMNTVISGFKELNASSDASIFSAQSGIKKKKIK